jgi:N-acetylglucosamine-6-phosphate deacetylase
MNLIKIINGKVITPDRILQQATVLVQGKKILEISEKDLPSKQAQVIDARGKYVSPGFIDIHTHGAGGADFMDRTVEACLKIAATHARYGTTALMPTTLTASTSDMLQLFEVYEEACRQNVSGATFVGIHLEGPYFAKEQAGAQDSRFIRNPDPEEYREIVAACKSLRRWSAAPELEGALEFAGYISSKGIIPSIAHTNAIAADIYPAFNAGFTMMTHLYSAMLGVTRRNAFRYAGAVEAAFLIEDMDVEIIADGIHLPPDLLKFICKFKGHDHIALVSDSMRAAGMPEGEYMLGDLEKGTRVTVENGVAKLQDKAALAASVATADRLVGTMVQQAGISLHDAVKMMTSNPARMINLPQKGSLIAGMDADIVIFDENIQIHLTMVEGNIVFQL